MHRVARAAENDPGSLVFVLFEPDEDVSPAWAHRELEAGEFLPPDSRTGCFAHKQRSLASTVESEPNLSRTVEIATSQGRQTAADLALRILDEVYAVAPARPTRIRLRAT